jgi:hypothetical protein
VAEGEVHRFEEWRDDHAVRRDERWSIEDLGRAVAELG